MRKIGGRKKSSEAVDCPTGSLATGTNMFRKLRVKPFSALGPINEHPSLEDAAATRTRTQRKGNEVVGSPRDDAGVDESSEPTPQEDPTSPLSSKKKKRGLGLFRNKVLRASGKARRNHPYPSSPESSEAVKPTPEAAAEEAPMKEDLEMTDTTVKERADRLYDVLNQSQTAAPQILEAARQKKPFDCASRLEPIPEKTATPTAVSKFAPFPWDATFGCAAPDEGDMPLSPPLSPDASSAMISPPASPTYSSDSVSPIDPTRSAETNSTFGSAPLYSEGIGAKEDAGIASPIFTALHNLDDALKADPNASFPPPTSVAASKSGEEIKPSISTAENPRIESYRLGYLLAQVGIPDERSGGGETPCPTSSVEPPTSTVTLAAEPPTHAGPSLGEVIQSIKKSAASEEIANVSLARVAADLAAANEANVDRDALKRGYLRRVSEIVKEEEKKGGAKGSSTKRSSSEVVHHAKNVLRDIECALNDVPAEPRSGDFTGLRLDNWSWLQSKSAEGGTERRDLPRDSSFNRASSSASRREGIRDNLAIVNLLSFFKSKAESDEADDSESEESSSTSESSRSKSHSGSSSKIHSGSSSSSSASSSHSSGVDISVPSRKRFVFSSTSIDTSRVEKVESEISEHSGTSSDSDDVNFSNSDQSELSLSQQSSHRSRDGRPLTPLGLVSFIRAMSKVKVNESLPADEQHCSSSVESVEGNCVSATKMYADPTAKRSHANHTRKDDRKKHEIRGDGGKRKFSPRTLFKQANSSSKPPLHPVSTTIERSSTSGSIESNVSTKHVELDLAVIVITSAFGGDGLESIELCTSPDHPYKGSTSLLVEVEMISNEQGDQVACEVKPRSDGVWNADESRDDFESMEHARSTSFSTTQSLLGGIERRDHHPRVEKTVSPSGDQVPSNGVFKESHNSNVPAGASSYDFPFENDNRYPESVERPGASVLDTDTVCTTEGVDLLELLVGSESGALWGRDGAEKSSESEIEDCPPSDFESDDHSLAQSEPNITTVGCSSPIHQSKVRNHGRGPSHKRSLSGPPTLLLNAVKGRPSAD